LSLIEKIIAYIKKDIEETNPYELLAYLIAYGIMMAILVFIYNFPK
jgi:hypothetical protein